MWFKQAMRFAVLILALALAGCTAREAVLPPAPVAEPINAAIVPLTLEQDRQISSSR